MKEPKNYSKVKTIDATNCVYIIKHETDYLNFVTKSSTKAQRRKFNIGDVYINAIVCVHCKDYIRSKNLHDFKYCKCGKVAIDGGSWYGRRLGEPEDYIELWEMFYDHELKNPVIK